MTHARSLICALLLCPIAGAQDANTCYAADRAFASAFTFATLLMTGLACFLLPILVFFVWARFRHGWWLTYPYQRCLSIAGSLFLLFVIVFIALPWLMTLGVIPPGWGLALFPGVPADYLGCDTVDFQTATLLGVQGISEGPLLFQPFFLFAILTSSAISFTGMHFLFFWLARLATRISPAREQ